MKKPKEKKVSRLAEMHPQSPHAAPKIDKVFRGGMDKRMKGIRDKG